MMRGLHCHGLQLWALPSSAAAAERVLAEPEREYSAYDVHRVAGLPASPTQRLDFVLILYLLLISF
jgi:hypothetical protein